MTLKSSPLALNRNRSCQHKASPSLFPHLVEGTSAIRPHPTSISHIRTFISDNHQKCIVTNWQCIGMHWHRSHQSHANRRTVAYISGELVYYVDRPKCLHGGRFRENPCSMRCHCSTDPFCNRANPRPICQS